MLVLSGLLNDCMFFFLNLFSDDVLNKGEWVLFVEIMRFVKVSFV